MAEHSWQDFMQDPNQCTEEILLIVRRAIKVRNWVTNRSIASDVFANKQLVLMDAVGGWRFAWLLPYLDRVPSCFSILLPHDDGFKTRRSFLDGLQRSNVDFGVFCDDFIKFASLLKEAGILSRRTNFTVNGIDTYFSDRDTDVAVKIATESAPLNDFRISVVVNGERRYLGEPGEPWVQWALMKMSSNIVDKVVRVRQKWDKWQEVTHDAIYEVNNVRNV